MTSNSEERIRLLVVLTHPIQYYSPWFRHITANCPELDLHVLYVANPTPQQQGAGFGHSFEWDIPLTSGYEHRFVRDAQSDVSFHSDHYRGLDVPEVAEAIADEEPDVVLVPGWNSISLVRAIDACRRLRIPVLFRGDTHLGNAPSGWRKFAWQLKQRLMLRRYHGFLGVGDRTHRYLRHFGIEEDLIFRAPHCVDNEFFDSAAQHFQSPGARATVRAELGFNEADYVVLFAGKLQEKKRPADVLGAASKLLPKAKVLFVGAGELEASCRSVALELGVEAVFAGFLNQSEIPQAFAAADCLVLPSDWGETWGLVVNEAMATGLPCILSDRVGCAPDLVLPGKTGELFGMGDIDGLALAIEKVRQNSSQYKPGAIKDHIAKYSFRTATEGLLSACRAMTASRTLNNSRRRRSRYEMPRPGGQRATYRLDRTAIQLQRKK